MWELIWGKTLHKTSLTVVRVVISMLAMDIVVMAAMGVVMEW